MPSSTSKKGGRTPKAKGRRSRQKNDDEESADEAVREKAYKKSGSKRGRTSKHTEPTASEQMDEDTLDVTGIDLEATRKTLYKAEDAYFNGVMPHKRAKVSTASVARDAGFLFGADPILRNSSSEPSESFAALFQPESSARPAPLALLPERQFTALRDELLLRERGVGARAPAGFRLSPRADESFDLTFPDAPLQLRPLPLCNGDEHCTRTACEAFGVGVSAFPQAPSTASACFTALPEVGAPQTKSVPHGHFQVYYLNTTAAACEELRRKAVLQAKKRAAPVFLKAFIRLALRSNASSKTEDAQQQQSQERLPPQSLEQHDSRQEGNAASLSERDASTAAAQDTDAASKASPTNENSEQHQLPSPSHPTSDQPPKVEVSTTTPPQETEHHEDQTAQQESASVSTPHPPSAIGTADSAAAAAADTHPRAMTFAQRYSLAKLCRTVPLLYAAPDKFVSSSLFSRSATHSKSPELDAEEVTKRGKEVVAYLLKQQGASAFAKPVDPEALGIPTYFDVVKHPMDLGTVMRKLEERAYATPDAFAADVFLVFDNATLFNPEGHSVHDAAVAMRRLFETRLRLSGLVQGSFDPTSVLRELDRELKAMKRELANTKRTRDDVRYQVTAKVVAPPKRLHRPPTSSGSRDTHPRRPQPKPKSAPKPAAPAQTSAEEKNRRLRQLHQQITRLPQEKLQDVVQIVQESMPINHDAEFELDLEKLSEQTLEKLEAFVRGAVDADPAPHAESEHAEDAKGGSPVILGDAMEGAELESKPFALDQGAWDADLTALDMGEAQQHEHEHEHEQTGEAPAVWGEKQEADAGEEFLKDEGEAEKHLSGAEDTFQKLVDEQRRQQQRAKEREAISQREREKAEEEKRAQEEQAARLAEEKRRAEEEERSRLKEEEERRIDGLKAGTCQTDEQTADLLSEYMG